MKLIEDLGTERLPSGKITRFCLCKCDSCNNLLKLRMSDFKNNPDRLCKKCCDILKSKTTSTFIAEAIRIHGSTYSYDKVTYVDRVTPVVITCSIHGDYRQKPHSHLEGSGCRACFLEVNRNQKTRKTTEDFIKQAIEKFGDVFDMSDVHHINNKTKVTIGCGLHGKFEIQPNNFLGSHRGCPACSKDEFAIAKRLYENIKVPTLLYYIYFNDLNLWKVGCTSKTVMVRFASSKLVVTTLYEKLYEESLIAYKVEQYILNSTLSTKYGGTNVLRGGNSELRVKEISNIKKLIEEAETIFLKQDTQLCV